MSKAKGKNGKKGRDGTQVLVDAIKKSQRSMHAVALEAGVDPSLLSKYSRGKVPVGEDNAVKLGEVLGVPAPALRHGDDWRKVLGL